MSIFSQSCLVPSLCWDPSPCPGNKTTAEITFTISYPYKKTKLSFNETAGTIILQITLP